MKVLILDKEIPYLLDGVLTARGIDVDVFAEVFETDPYYKERREHYQSRFNLCTLQEIEMRLSQYDTVFVNELPSCDLTHITSNHKNVIGCLRPEIELDKVLFKRIAMEVGHPCIPSTVDIDLNDLPDMTNWTDRDVMIKVRDQAACGSRVFSYHAKSVKSVQAFLNYCRTASQRDVGYDPSTTVFLEEFIKGDEVGVGAWFTGKQFVGPYHMWFEYKKILAYDVGPNVEEIGVACRVIPPPQRSQLCRILRRFEQYLQDLDYVGYFSLNAIMNDKNTYLLECDARFPNPGLLAIAHTCDLKNLLLNPRIAQQTVYPDRWYVCGSVVSIGFPWAHTMGNQIGDVDVYLPNSDSAVPINLIFQSDERHLAHYKTPPPAFCDFGRIAEVMGRGDTLEDARNDWLRLMQDVSYPFALWRYDIGMKSDRFERTIIQDYERY
jgi:phosphoribosylamine-glycine ligase